MDGAPEIREMLNTLLERSTRTDESVKNLRENMNEKLAGLSESVGKIADISDRTLVLEGLVKGVENNCLRIQAERAAAFKRRAVPWGAIFGSVMSGLIVGLIMLAVNIAVK